jgi:hypothetical protein
MKPTDIEVGAVYRLGGQYRIPKLVLFVDLADRSVRGGKVRIRSITALRSSEVWSAEYFAEQVVEKML